MFCDKQSNWHRIHFYMYVRICIYNINIYFHTDKRYVLRLSTCTLWNICEINTRPTRLETAMESIYFASKSLIEPLGWNFRKIKQKLFGDTDCRARNYQEWNICRMKYFITLLKIWKFLTEIWRIHVIFIVEKYNLWNMKNSADIKSLCLVPK